ncbi:hypothetical protein [Bradyrhizobium erythrophlei]|uniref:Uncharacterized protein n=1 Tax=Bradyrhizobium erythrophlei TaxID=1437360 RepID=A0A1M5I7C0_9BRAD|nr:hypothetical protein [Bradyrhizobium erythrophlei]SHG24186.1 hypothetical protein SAMN05443248_0838 [Bradyrhizobium erythrophlei]
MTGTVKANATIAGSESIATGFEAAFAKGNTTTKADLLSRSKDAIETGDQLLHDAAEALALAQQDFKASQREIAEAVGKSVAWVNRLLQWQRHGCVGTPFGPSSKAGRELRKRVQSSEQRALHRVETDDAGAGTDARMIESTKRTAVPSPQAGDVALADFTARVLDLITRTDKREAKRFAATAVPADDLAKLGKFLTDLANCKKSEAVEPAPITALPANGAVPVGQPAVKVEHAAPEAGVDRVA